MGAPPPAALALVVQTAHAKPVKDALKSAHLLDLSRSAGHNCQLCGHPAVALPCVPFASDTGVQLPPEVTHALASGVAGWQHAALATRHRATPPATALRDSVRTLLHAAGLPDELLDDLPTRWEKLGDVALLPENSLRDERWAPLLAGGTLYPAVASALGASRLARQARVDPGPLRSSRATLLWPPGADGATVVAEHGLRLSLDVTQSMFSSGNGTEKQRMARLPAAGETVVDLFAGIGYWTLPLLVHARVAHVYACEWNPPSCDALEANLALNGIPSGCCTVLRGDCRQLAPRGVAHRVILGLLPDATCGYASALHALRRDMGGVLHVHGCAAAGQHAAWGTAVAEELQRMLLDDTELEARAWTARVLHVEVVKSYAPRVLHCVSDIKVVRLHAPSAADVHRAAVATRTPAVLTGLEVGPCTDLWTRHYLQAHADGCVPVTVHVSDTPYLSWHPVKNFTLRNMSLAELVAMTARDDATKSSRRHVYMRAVGRDPRAEPACLAASFPRLAADVALPPCCGPPDDRGVHSTVLRVASPGLALWLHYDALDNCLVQLVGRKRVRLYPLAAAGGLYLSGSSSRVPTAMVWDAAAEDADDDASSPFPSFLEDARAACVEVCLHPGEAVFIPRYWAHAVLCDPEDDLSVAVNCFWNPPEGEPRASGDVYGNADPPPASQALQAARAAAAALAQLPADAHEFYSALAASIVRDA